MIRTISTIEDQTLLITQDDKPVLAVMPYMLYEACLKARDILEILLETILEDRDLMTELYWHTQQEEGRDPIMTDRCDGAFRGENLD